MKTYTPTEFALPKVVGLAVHNARKRTEARVADCQDRSIYPTPPEVQSYCLFGVNPDCTVVPLASGSTASDMEPIIRKSNLALLGKKYGLIGFVHARTPKRTKEYADLGLPKEGSTK
jgi:hypothetical protein